jgi:sulfate adenylyltransferase subunit 1 (EFTu-like GTPase family)
LLRPLHAPLQPRPAALPGARRSKVARIIGPDGEREEAIAGEAVTLTLTDEIDVSRGDVLASTPHHLKPRRNMEARLLWMIDAPLAPGRDYIIQLATGTANARIAALHHQIDVESFQPRPAQVLTMNQIGFVSLACDKALVMADYRQDRDLGAFILIDRLTNQTAAL